MANDKRFTIATSVGARFCDPRGPWQRRSNENHQCLLPKGTDLSRLLSVAPKPDRVAVKPTAPETFGFGDAGLIDLGRCCNTSLETVVT